jgi:hypothetical protein
MRPAFRIIVFAIAIVLSGCASTEEAKHEETVSSIPWNRPQSWEGQGPFGSMLQQQGGRY